MDLVDLAIFKMVAQEGGIVRAARKLHRVQSNVTTRIKQLEQSVGAQRFFRERQRLHLSPDGELLLSYAERLLQLADEARASVGGGELRGTLRLGPRKHYGKPPAKTFGGVPPGTPDVRVETFTNTNDALIVALADRRVDAAFVAEVPNRDGMSQLPVFAERLVLITAVAPAGATYRRRGQLHNHCLPHAVDLTLQHDRRSPNLLATARMQSNARRDAFFASEFVRTSCSLLEIRLKVGAYSAVPYFGNDVFAATMDLSCAPLSRNFRANHAKTNGRDRKLQRMNATLSHAGVTDARTMYHVTQGER